VATQLMRRLFEGRILRVDVLAEFCPAVPRVEGDDADEDVDSIGVPGVMGAVMLLSLPTLQNSELEQRHDGDHHEEEHRVCCLVGELTAGEAASVNQDGH